MMKYPGSGPPLAHKPDPFEPCEVAGDRGLANRGENPEIIDTAISSAECIQHLDTDRMAKRF